MLTEREQQIVELLRSDPLMGSTALAEWLGTSRASVNVHLSNLGKKGVILGRGYVLAQESSAVVVGGSNIDFKAQSDSKAKPHTSNPGHGSMTPGGVGRNIAENMALLGTQVHLISAIGRDPMGDDLLRHTAAAGVRTEHVLRTHASTGTYTAVLDANGELIIAISDMDGSNELGPEHLGSARDVIGSAALVVLDGNLSAESVDCVLGLADGVQVVLDPVSVAKAERLSGTIDDRIYGLTPNRDELSALTELPTRTDRQVRTAAMKLHELGVELVWVRLGERGSLLSTASGAKEIPALAAQVQDVTGAGDAMLGAFCHRLLTGGSAIEAAHFGQAAASLTVASPHTVRPDLTARLIQTMMDSR